MQLFLAACGDRPVDPNRLARALRAAAARIPHMDLDDVLVRASASSRTAVAAVSHPEPLAAPRRYRALRGEEVCVFDGRPVTAHHDLAAGDAEALLAAWERLPEALEGQFSVLRARLDEDRVEALSDPFALAPLYVARIPGLALVGNSVAAVAALAGLGQPDPAGVSTYLSFGWAGEHHTLVEGVRVVPGATRVTLAPGEIREEVLWSPAQALAEARRAQPDPEGFVEEMVALTRAAVSDGAAPVRCAVTAGRDTRAILALLRATPAGAEADYGTVGGPDDEDVRIAVMLAREMGFPHRVIPPDPRAIAGDPEELIATFLALTDGMSTLLQVADIGDLGDPLDRLGVQLSGVGGEFARPGSGPVKGFAPHAPVVRDLRTFQTRVLQAKTRTGGLVTPAGEALARAHLDRFVELRLGEGWRTRELAEAFFVHERVGRWGASGVRRASARDDWFSPFCTRPFLAHALTVSPGERYVERPHHQILSLEPRLRDLPYAHPWRPQRPRLAPLMVARAAARMAAERLGPRLPRPRLRPRGAARPAPPPPSPPFGITWLFAHRDLHLAKVRSVPESPLWTWIDRAALERGLAGEPGGEREGSSLLRAMTLLWYFHGPVAPGAEPPAGEPRAAVAAAPAEASEAPAPAAGAPPGPTR